MSTLVLLVGTNPLPNYVVAKYLITKTDGKKFDRILLVHSKDTEYQADRLHKVLRDQLKQVSEPCPLGQSTVANDINKVMYSKLATLPENEDIHLNYTGGRKTMSVHVHAALTKLKNNQSNRSVTFSYLDSSNYILRYDDDEGHVEPKDPVSGKQGDLRNFVKLDFETELLALHGYEKVKLGSEPDYLPVAEWIFQQARQHPAKDSLYTRLHDWAGFTKTKEGLKNLIATDHPWPNDPAFDELGNLIATEFGLTVEECTWAKFPPNNEKLPLPRRDKLCKFLEGGWLEPIVFAQLVKFVEDINYLNPPITACYVDIVAKRQHDMQIDVALLRGYELVLLSITTIGYGSGYEYKKDGSYPYKSEVKGKGFEAIHRAAQLGGEEARPILICLAGPLLKKAVTEDLEDDFGGDISRKTLSVFGHEDLQDLATALQTELKR